MARKQLPGFVEEKGQTESMRKRNLFYLLFPVLVMAISSCGMQALFYLRFDFTVEKDEYREFARENKIDTADMFFLDSGYYDYLLCESEKCAIDIETTKFLRFGLGVMCFDSSGKLIGNLPICFVKPNILTGKPDWEEHEFFSEFPPTNPPTMTTEYHSTERIEVRPITLERDSLSKYISPVFDRVAPPPSNYTLAVFWGLSFETFSEDLIEAVRKNRLLAPDPDSVHILFISTDKMMEYEISDDE